MKDKIRKYFEQMDAKKLKKWIFVLYLIVIIVVAIFFVIGRLNMIETLITYVMLALCLIPVLKL